VLGSIEDLAVRLHRDPMKRQGRTSTVASKPLERVAVQFGDGDPSMEREPFGEDTQTARALHRWLCPLRLRLQVLREQVHPVCSFVLLRRRSELLEQAGDQATGYPFQIRHSGRRERVELNISVGSLGKYPVRYQRVEVKV